VVGNIASTVGAEGVLSAPNRTTYTHIKFNGAGGKAWARSITSNDLHISRVVDAWWTRNDVKFGPPIDFRSMTLRSGNALPNNAIQVANVSRPTAMPLLLIALGGLGFAARRCKTT